MIVVGEFVTQTRVGITQTFSVHSCDLAKYTFLALPSHTETVALTVISAELLVNYSISFESHLQSSAVSSESDTVQKSCSK